MAMSTITSKGQITIPKQIRDRFQLRQGHRVEFCVNGEGQIILKPRNGDIRMLKGILRSPFRRPMSVRAMNKAIAEGFARAGNK